MSKRNKNNAIKPFDILDFNSVKSFLDSGGDPNFPKKTIAKQPLLIELLREHYFCFFTGEVNEDLLNEKSLEIIKLLLDYGGNIHLPDEFGDTPLHVAAMCSEKITEFLLQKGAHLHRINVRGDTPLHRIVDLGFPVRRKITKLLLDYGAKVYYENFSGETPVFIAAVNCNYKITHMLLEKDPILINAKNNKGITPLFRLVYPDINHHYPLIMIELLLKYGADIHIQDLEGNSPFQIVSESKDSHSLKIKKLFLKYEKLKEIKR